MGTDTQPRLHDKAFAEENGILYESYSSLCGPCPKPQNMELITGSLVTGIGRKHGKSGAQVARHIGGLGQLGPPLLDPNVAVARLVPPSLTHAEP